MPKTHTPETGARKRFLAPVFHASCKISGTRKNIATVLLVSWFTYVDVRSYLLAVTVKYYNYFYSRDGSTVTVLQTHPLNNINPE